MTAKEKKEFRKKLKEETGKQEQLLQRLASGEPAPEKGLAYIFELCPTIAYLNIPKTAEVRRDGAPEIKALTQAEVLAALNVTPEDIVYAIGYDEGNCFIRKRDVPERCSPVDFVYSSLLNSMKVSERCRDEVDKAFCAAKLILEDNPQVEYINQTGRLLDIVRDEEEETETGVKFFAVYEKNTVEYYCRNLKRNTDFAYRIESIPAAGLDIREFFLQSVEYSGRDRTTVSVADLKEVNEPYRITQHLEQFRHFEYRREGEWLRIMMSIGAR